MSNAFEEEKKYLEYAKQKILDEMEFCRKEMLEIPKRYPNALQGDSFLVQGLMSSIATKLKKWSYLKIIHILEELIF